MQAPGPHGLDLGGIGLHGIEQNPFSGDGCQVIEKLLPHLSIDRRVFDRGVGKNERRRIELLGRIAGNIRDHIAVIVLVAVVELKRGHGGYAQRRRYSQCYKKLLHALDAPSLLGVTRCAPR